MFLFFANCLVFASDYIHKQTADRAISRMADLARTCVNFFKDEIAKIQEAEDEKTSQPSDLKVFYALPENSGLLQKHIDMCEKNINTVYESIKHLRHNLKTAETTQCFILKLLHEYGEDLAFMRTQYIIQYLMRRDPKTMKINAERIYEERIAYTQRNAQNYYRSISDFTSLLGAKWYFKQVETNIEELRILFGEFHSLVNTEISELFQLFPSLKKSLNDYKHFVDPDELALTDGTEYLCTFGKTIQLFNSSGKPISETFIVFDPVISKISQTSFTVGSILKSSVPRREKSYLKETAISSNAISTEKKRSEALRSALSKYWHLSRKLAKEKRENFQTQRSLLQKAYEMEQRRLARPKKDMNRQKLSEPQVNLSMINIMPNIFRQDKKESSSPKEKYKTKGVSNPPDSGLSTIVWINTKSPEPVRMKRADVLVSLLEVDRTRYDVLRTVVPALERIGINVDSSRGSSHWVMSYGSHKATLCIPHGSRKGSSAVVTKGRNSETFDALRQFLYGAGFYVTDGQLISYPEAPGIGRNTAHLLDS